MLLIIIPELSTVLLLVTSGNRWSNSHRPSHHRHDKSGVADTIGTSGTWANCLKWDDAPPPDITELEVSACGIHCRRPFLNRSRRKPRQWNPRLLQFQAAFYCSPFAGWCLGRKPAWTWCQTMWSSCCSSPAAELAWGRRRRQIWQKKEQPIERRPTKTEVPIVVYWNLWFHRW